MTFKRYEIRTFFKYPNGETDFGYVPFNLNHTEVLNYISKHEQYKSDTDSYVCMVTLHSDYDECKKLATTKEYWELHERGIL